MKNILLALWLSFFSVVTFAQNPEWDYGKIPEFDTTLMGRMVAEVSTGETIVVPSSRARTIQEAVNLRPSVILLTAGKFDENVVIPSGVSVTIRSKEVRLAIIDGGDRGNTIAVGIYARVRLENVIILNSQPKRYYDTAAVFGWGGVGIDIVGSNIYTKSIGVSGSYPSLFSIAGGRIIGQDAAAVGVLVNYHTGSTVLDTFFTKLKVGIDARNSLGVVQPVTRCQGKVGCVDTNDYEEVAYRYLE